MGLRSWLCYEDRYRATMVGVVMGAKMEGLDVRTALVPPKVRVRSTSRLTYKLPSDPASWVRVAA